MRVTYVLIGGSMKHKKEESQIDKIVLAATLYYKNNLSQQEIANRLNVSRPWVSKLLTRAQEMGIVQITIHSPVSGDDQLERSLKEKYGITHVSVISQTEDNKDYISQAMANYFISQVQSGDIIGVGWGNAVSRFINELIPVQVKDVQIVPMAGSFGTTFETLPNYSAIQLANKLEGHAKVLHAPAFCADEKEYETLMQNQSVSTTLDLAQHADIIVTGIGTFGSSFLTKHDILSDENVQDLKDQHAIGDIILQFLDHEGHPVVVESTRYLIKADIFQARKNARSILAMAQGVEKKEIIHTVLSLGLVDAFFTDKETALALLEG